MRVPDQCIAQCLRTIAMALPLLFPSAVLYASPIIAIGPDASQQETIAAHNPKAAPFEWRKQMVHPVPLKKHYANLRN